MTARRGPRRPRVALGAALALQHIGVVVSDDVLIQAARLDLLRPDRRSLRMVSELLDHGPEHLALAASGR